MCENEAINGVTRDGGYAEYVLLRTEAVVRVPRDVDPVEYASSALASRSSILFASRTSSLASWLPFKASVDLVILLFNVRNRPRAHLLGCDLLNLFRREQAWVYSCTLEQRGFQT